MVSTTFLYMPFTETSKEPTPQWGILQQKTASAYSVSGFRLAAGLGFEPRQTESESVVLPLHHPATDPSARRRATQQRRIYHRPVGDASLWTSDLTLFTGKATVESDMDRWGVKDYEKTRPKFSHAISRIAASADACSSAICVCTCALWDTGFYRLRQSSSGTVSHAADADRSF